MQKKPEKIQKKSRDFILVAVMAFFLLGLSLVCWTKEEDIISESERRVLAKFPNISTKAILDGEFMEKFEIYSVDQFPFRDGFRTLKSMAQYGIFQKKDNNEIYIVDGYLSKMEYPMQPKMLDYAVSHIEKIYNLYLKPYDSKCYFTVIPDKNYFLAEENGYLSMDYEEFFSYMKEKLDFTQYLDITRLLSLEDYYKTDTHWRQEKILDVAEYLKKKMDGSIENEKGDESKNISSAITEYEVKAWEEPFYGVYCGQSALPVKPETLYYMESDVLKMCKVTSYDTQIPQDTTIYNMEKGKGNDAYELFLSGTSALQVIENPMMTEEKELIVFRDSFGSSLIPLLVDAYSKITVIDTRYVQSAMLGNLVDFRGQDVLFLYSTLILNQSMSMK